MAAYTGTIVVADTTLAAGETTTVTFTFSSDTYFQSFLYDYPSALSAANGSLSWLTPVGGGSEGELHYSTQWVATLTATSSAIVDTTNVVTIDNVGELYVQSDGSDTAPIASSWYSNNYAVDTVRPTVTSIVVADSALKAGETSLVTFTFSEAVTGFSNLNLTVDNGTLSWVSSSDGGVTWTATFVPDSYVTDANNVITLDNSGVTDLAGNTGSGTTDSNTYAIDTVRPTITSIVVADTALKAGETSLVTFTFSEAVTGFTNADLSVQDGTLSTVSSSDGGTTWTATLTPDTNVTGTARYIRLYDSEVTDLAGNSGGGSDTFSNSYDIDTARPTVTISMAFTSLAIGETSGVFFSFSEPVTGLTTADLTVANGTLSSVSSVDGILWTATFTPTAGIEDTTNVITLDNTGVTDAAGNTGSGTTSSNNYAVDTVRPTATIVVADTALRGGETTGVTITFSEAVTGFTNADLSVENGTLSSVSSSDGGVTWTATFTPTASITDSTNVITLDNTGVADLAGNTGSGSTSSNNYRIDTARPTTTIVVADVDLAVGETSVVTFTFSEAVTGFTNADLTVENGTLTSLASADGGVTWTATFTPTADIVDATNVITLDNTGVVDAAGNAGTGTTSSDNYAIDTFVDDAPTAVRLENALTSLSELASTATPIKVANIIVEDSDGGPAGLTLSGADAALFSIDGNDLYLNAGSRLDFETNPSLDVVVTATGGANADLSVAILDEQETFIGTNGADFLVGTRSNDVFIGKDGNDGMVGGDGADKFLGGKGMDVIWGGAGADRFIFNTVGERDIIRDFEHGVDKIDLSALDASVRVAGDQAFRLGGSGIGSLQVSYENFAGTANDRTLITGDINGDNRADFTIELSGLKALTAGDFIF